MRTGLVEAIEHRQDILNIFGIRVRIEKGIEQGVVFGAQLLLQVIYPLKQRFSFLTIFLGPCLMSGPIKAMLQKSACRDSRGAQQKISMAPHKRLHFFTCKPPTVAQVGAGVVLMPNNIESYDVIVVGGGAAGVGAAVGAARAGARTLMIESLPRQ
jgi:hypothetical protein